MEIEFQMKFINQIICFSVNVILSELDVKNRETNAKIKLYRGNVK